MFRAEGQSEKVKKLVYGLIGLYDSKKDQVYCFEDARSEGVTLEEFLRNKKSDLGLTEEPQVFFVNRNPSSGDLSFDLEGCNEAAHSKIQEEARGALANREVSNKLKKACADYYWHLQQKLEIELRNPFFQKHMEYYKTLDMDSFCVAYKKDEQEPFEKQKFPHGHIDGIIEKYKKLKEIEKNLVADLPTQKDIQKFLDDVKKNAPLIGRRRDSGFQTFLKVLASVFIVPAFYVWKVQGREFMEEVDQIKNNSSPRPK